MAENGKRLTALTDEKGQQVWVNRDLVISVTRGKKGLTVITMVGNPPVKISVSDPLDSVLYAINRCL